MENLERIIAKIVEEAEKEAKFILDDAEKKSHTILLEAKNKVENAKKELEKEYELIEKYELDRIKSATALKSRNIVLESKQKTMEYIFNELNSRVKHISYEDMTKYILKTLENRNLSSDEKIIIPKAYENIDINREYILSDQISTGFMIEKNGIYENYTLEALIDFNKDDIEAKIQKLLFN